MHAYCVYGRCPLHDAVQNSPHAKEKTLSCGSQERQGRASCCTQQPLSGCCLLSVIIVRLGLNTGVWVCFVICSEMVLVVVQNSMTASIIAPLNRTMHSVRHRETLPDKKTRRFPFADTMTPARDFFTGLAGRSPVICSRNTFAPTKRIAFRHAEKGDI
jgi:hypothetical protein